MSILQCLFDSASICYKFTFNHSSDVVPCHFSTERLEGLRSCIGTVQAATNTGFEHLLDEHGNGSVTLRLLLEVVGDECSVREGVGFVVAVPTAGRIEGFFNSMLRGLTGRHY